MSGLIALFGSFAFLWFALAWIACGAFCGHLAGEKNRCGFCWFCLGVLFGPLALIAAAGLPDNRQVSPIYADTASVGMLPSPVDQEPRRSEVIGYQAGKAIKDPPVWIGLIVLAVVLYFGYSYMR